MPTIFQSTTPDFSLTQTKLGQPVSIKFPAGKSWSDFKQGSLVSTTIVNGSRTAVIISDSNDDAQAKNCRPVYSPTSQDTAESGHLTVFEGHFRAATKVYTAGTYAANDYLTVKYDSNHGGGALCAADGTSTHYIAKVEVPPAAAGQPMEVLFFASPVTIDT